MALVWSFLANLLTFAVLLHAQPVYATYRQKSMRAQFNRFSTTISFYVLKSLLRSLVSGKKIQTFGRGCSVREMTLVWSCFWFMVSLLTLALLVHGQPGFVSIDCGIANDSNGYIENDITYISDAQFIETGVNENVRINRKELLRLYRTVRSFPDGKRNCYKLGSLNKSNKYLIRASFMYGDYDGKNMTPKFDLYIGASRGITISFSNATDSTYEEIIIVATMNFISFCLVNTGYGTPFISGLKLRPLANTMYGVVNESQSLRTFMDRSDVGRSIDSGDLSYPDDSFDRYWWPKEDASWTPLRTLQNVTNKDKATEPPSTVMMTAVCPLNNSDALYFNWTVDDSSQQFHVYMHFAELELLGSNMTREFTACCSNNTCYNSPIRPEYHVTTTVQTSQPLTGQYNYYCSIKKTPTSTLPPILNAIEIFTILQLTEKPTREDDVEAMVDIKATYKMKRNWMGDPCLPEIYKWEGLTCSNNQSDAPAVVSLNLSSAGLKGKIAASLSNLKSIRSLDLSWNNLIGPVPNFLGDLPFLLSLDLSGNQLSGLIPSNLIEKSKRGSLKLSLDGNPDLCVPGSCSRHSSKRKITILIAASVASVVILSILLIILRRFKWRKEVLIVEANRTSALQLSENRRITITEDPVVMASNASGSLLYADQQITSPEDPVVETNNTGDALLSEGRQIISTNDTVAGASKIGGSLPSDSRQFTSAEDPVVDANNIIGRPLLLEDSVVNETGSSLLSEDQWITCPEYPVVKANRTGSSLLSKNRPFTYDEVSVITNGFKRFLGKGAFGKVYYGKMTDGTELAVKMLFPQSVKLLSDLSKQFENEAQLLMRVHHRNLVPFIGYCQEGDNMALIYEYMAEGDLGSHLLGKKGNSKALNWDQRLHIGLDVAQGLEYLHDGCNPPIIHRDIKTANILLNERFEAKIGDFGLSKVFLKYDESSHISTGIKGTEGYIDPEYDTSKHLTKKSDVYSFGVVLFRLITALPATIQRNGTDKIDLVDWANRTIALAPIEGVVDPKLEGVHDANSLEKAAEIARLCTSKKPEERPTMFEVVAKLKDCLETEAAAKRIRDLVNIEQQVE